MSGLQPPSSSSSRIRSRPRSAAAAATGTSGAISSSPQRTQTKKTVVTNATPSTNNTVPLESVVIQHSNKSTPSSSRNTAAATVRGNTNSIASSGDNTNNNDNDNTTKTTNVKVCVRLRPMLSSDFKANAAIMHGNSNNNNGNINGNATPVGKAGGRAVGGFARDTTASSIHRHQTTPRKKQTDTAGTGNGGVMKKHTSGLATPLSPKQSNTTEHQEQNQALLEQNQPSWTTTSNTNKPNTQISQASHTASHTSHHNPDRLKDYTFDRVYSPTDSTDVLYEESIKGVVGSVVEGFHGSVFAYGQTNSGKTHTMTGSPNEAGVVRLAVQDIFHRIQKTCQSTSTSTTSNREYLVRVSYLEIYNEQIYDLLALPETPRGGGKGGNRLLQHHHLPPSTTVRIFESRTEGVVIRGLREEIVTCPEDVFVLLDSGDAKRKVGSTGMNKTSSRSHSVFRLVLESSSSSSSSSSGTSSKHNNNNNGGIPPSSNSSINSDGDSVATGKSSITQSTLGANNAKGPVRISSLSLVDLAGSESVKATGSTGVRQKEGQYINKSLLTLGHVVHKLSDMSMKEQQQNYGGAVVATAKEHIPYRDSKLTRLLQPSLGGNAQVCIICNISPALSNLEESHNTLKFAMRAKKIQQHARITEVADEKTLLRSYREEIEELKRQLKEAKQQQQTVVQTPQIMPRLESRESDSDDDDQDDAHVLVSAIKNLESLILKAGSKSTRKPAVAASALVKSDESLPRQSLDAALKKAEESFDDDGMNQVTTISTPGMSSSENRQAENEDDEHDDGLLEELHRIQGMLGTVMKKKHKGGSGGGGVGKSLTPTKTPQRDAEVERLRMQLKEQEVASTMRKADSSFLQSELDKKENLLNQVSVLLSALEKRQLELEQENKQLRGDLAEAANMIEEGDLARKALETRLAEKEGSEALLSDEKKVDDISSG